ncbi:hypothetical protein [Streptomyces virginiae]|uniref:hypothetical protein n=1 Tax=Streptomyces virginiae TaxID=1961 RepID=UPI0034515B38
MRPHGWEAAGHGRLPAPGDGDAVAHGSSACARRPRSRSPGTPRGEPYGLLVGLFRADVLNLPPDDTLQDSG